MFATFLILFTKVLFELLWWAIFIYVIMSWVGGQNSNFGQTLRQIVQPILKPFRMARIGMLDFSPIVALLALGFLSNVATEFLNKFL
jgi:YggT family protein